MQTTEHAPEQVMVIPVDLANSLAKTHNSLSDLEAKIMAAHSFRERSEAETNYAFKQVIPYITVYYGAIRQQYLLSQRTDKQQESRLHSKYSLGQGGHINTLDFRPGANAFTACIAREIEEEFHLQGPILSLDFMCLINDDSTDVGKVHLGLLFFMQVGSLGFEVAEKGKHTAQWIRPLHFYKYYAQMESWSQKVVERLMDAAEGAIANQEKTA